MKKFILLIIRRYLTGTKEDKNISTMILVCFIGIFIGTFALALVASIMNGFEKVTHEKLRGIHAHITMRSFDNAPLQSSKIEQVLAQEFPEIQAFSPTMFKQVLLQAPGSDQLNNAVIMKGIDPVKEIQTSSLGQKNLVGPYGPLSLEKLLENNRIVLGKTLAQTLQVNPGDPLDIIFIPDEKKNTKTLKLTSHQATVGGTFSTGMDEFDSNLILAPFSLMQELFSQAGITQYNITLKPHANQQETIARLKKRFNLDVFSWQELYPALVSALKLEKYAMFFILALITLVACMNIISLIYMQITQKRPDIAIYLAMGMPIGTISTIFIGMGLMVSLCATALGLLGAYGAGLILEHYPFITLPDTYYMSHLPIYMEWHIFLLIFAIILGLSFIASWLATRKIQSIQVANILRFESQ